jgi:hypothetical protein
LTFIPWAKTIPSIQINPSFKADDSSGFIIIRNNSFNSLTFYAYHQGKKKTSIGDEDQKGIPYVSYIL